MPLLLQEGWIEVCLGRKPLQDALDARYVPETVKVSYEISFALYLCKPTRFRSLDRTRADILEP